MTALLKILRQYYAVVHWLCALLLVLIGGWEMFALGFTYSPVAGVVVLFMAPFFVYVGLNIVMAISRPIVPVGSGDFAVVTGSLGFMFTGALLEAWLSRGLTYGIWGLDWASLLAVAVFPAISAWLYTMVLQHHRQCGLSWQL